ncbi:hypothetical protein D3C87_1884440 [compost metagenome]
MFAELGFGYIEVPCRSTEAVVSHDGGKKPEVVQILHCPVSEVRMMGMIVSVWKQYVKYPLAYRAIVFPSYVDHRNVNTKVFP